MKDAFSGYHPVVNMAFFLVVFTCTMFFVHPVCMGISLLGSFLYSVCLKGKSAVLFSLKILLPMFFFTVILNPLFNHRGVRILAYLPDGNPLTLESIVYGAAAGIMLVSVVLWFSCFHEVMSSDKFVYLFGRLLPALSLMLSMTLCFVPRFKERYKTVSNAQICLLGDDKIRGGIVKKAKYGIKILSIMITWSFESAIETADSMRGRGYGLPGRSAFHPYRFDRRDRRAVFCMLLGGGVVFAGALSGSLHYRYFPSMRGAAFTPVSAIFFLSYLMISFMPLIINFREDRKWKAIESAV